MKLIDLHCHILPNIDDGAQSEEESLIMLKKAVTENIDKIVVTPHYNSKYKTSLEQIKSRRDTLQRVINNNDIPITLVLGQEIRIYGELLEDYLNGHLLGINQKSRYILIEFANNDIPHYSNQLFYNMQCSGLVPIIVHPERNGKILEQPQILYQFIQKGLLAQITASSITGHFGRKIQKFSFKLLESNLAHFVASDAHNINSRDFRMKKAFELLEKRYGFEYIKEINNNARAVVMNEKIYVDLPRDIRQGLFYRLNKKKWK